MKSKRAAKTATTKGERERTSRAAGVVDKAASASARAGQDMNAVVTDTLKCLLAAATNSKKIAGNNFNCVKCALSFVLSFAIPLSLYIYLSLSNTLCLSLPPFLSLFSVLLVSLSALCLRHQRPSCSKIKFLIRPVGSAGGGGRCWHSVAFT